MEKEPKVKLKPFTEDQKEKEHYSEKTNVNGINIIVEWNKGIDFDGGIDYSIYFPDFETNPDERVTQSSVIIGKKAETAKEVFDFATKVAREEKDIYNVYKRVIDFMIKLPKDDDGIIIRDKIMPDVKPVKKERYSEKANVNGIDISVSWDGRDYIMYFPGLKVDHGDRTFDELFNGVFDDGVLGGLVIGQDAEKAKEVFDFATQAAREEKDPNSFQKKVIDYVTKLQEDEGKE